MLIEALVLAYAGSATQEPKMLCAEQTAFILAPGEKLKSIGPGIHVGTAVIKTRHGELIIKDGHSWREPKSVEEEVLLNSGVRIAKARSWSTSEGVAYVVYGRLDGRSWGEGISSKEQVVAWLSGSALQGNERDDGILERFRVVPIDSSKCTYQLNYGWDVILEDE